MHELGKFVNFIQVFEEKGGVEYLEKAELEADEKNYQVARKIIENYFGNREMFIELEEVSSSLTASSTPNYYQPSSF